MSIPTRIGKFEILRRIGKGAMGEVFLGKDPALGREVAIKTILASSAFGDEAKARFEREARSTALLNHPNIVTVFEFGETEGLHYLAMEYLEGEDLETLIQRQGLTREEALEVLAQTCEGLAYAHEHGVVHRDVKPANILVLRRGQRLAAKLMDFGVALVNQSNLTQEGIWMGTANYMAPEYLDTGKATASSDLFAIGVILYEVLTGGRKPFAGETTTLVLNAILRHPPAPFQAQETQSCGPGLLEIVHKALAKRPEDRFQSAEALADAIRGAARDGRALASDLPPAVKREAEKSLFIVGRGGGANCLSLRVALRQAAPGALIKLLPGHYRESLTVDKDVTIATAGEPGEAVLETCLVLKAGSVRMHGLLLQQAVQEPDGPAPAVLVEAGHALLEDCEVVASTGTAMRATGSGTQLAMTRCRVHGPAEVALDLQRSASAILAQCLLEGFERVGVRADLAASVVMSQSTVQQGEGVGLGIKGQAQAQLEDCELLDCRAGGLEVETEGRASLQRCRIAGSSYAGVLALDKGQATLEACELSDHEAAGVHVAEGAIASLQNCHIHRNPGFGVSTIDQGLCTLMACEVDANSHPGVFVQQRGTVQVKDSRLHDGGSLGVACAALGRGVLEGCEIYGNAQSGAKVERGGSLLLVRCVLRDGRDTGMLLFEDAEVTLEECVVHRNARGGILLAKDASDPILRGGNQIEDDLLRVNPQGGVSRLAPVKRH